MAAMRKAKYDVALVGVGVGANYGSVLTYYSLYRTLESFGKKVLMVSKIGASADDPELRDTHAIRFARKHYNLSPVYSQQNVGELNKVAETFVIGSDQVWNYGISQNFGKAFYLDFAGDDKRKISYAASFGHARDFAPGDEVPRISVLMKRFHAISVREDSGVRIARDVYGVPAKQVAEPIFLTDAAHYLDMASASTRDTSDPYLLAYILDPTLEKKKAIEHIAGKLGLKIRIILDAWPHLFQENKRKMNIDGAVEEGIETHDFLKLYANCSYVVTDSFHGTAFALKFEKPFASIGNRRRGVARFDSMFRLIGHRERFTLEAEQIVAADEKFTAHMDYSEIRRSMDRHVAESKAWLEAALKKRIRDTVGTQQGNGPGSVWRSKLAGTSGRMISRAARLLKHQITKQRFCLSAPAFSANNTAWRIERTPTATRLTVASADAAARGNLAWTDLPAPLRADGGYELTLDWSLRTAARMVNVHLRNPQTGHFKVVGAVAGDRGAKPRCDTMSFIVPGEGYSQIMFGAVHFRGPDAGADIETIVLRSVAPESVVPGAAAIPTRNLAVDAAAAVKELSSGDSDRFIEAYAQHRVSRSVANARSLLMYYSHGFEKGLSRTRGFRPGFGQPSMPKLAEEMNKWVRKGRDVSDSFFQIAASVMHVYFARHRELGVDVSHFWKLFDPSVQEQITRADPALGGALPAGEAREETLGSLPERSFADVVFARRSVREFLADPVSNEDIRRAVRIAMQAPSVCNRQGIRVHQFDDTDKMRAVLELQGGFRGYKLPPKLLLVTSDLAAFVAAVERNQPFIDGGLFMMLLLLGLEQVGLGSCSLNTAMNAERESAIRKILGIPDNEVFISFVAVGHFDPAVMVPRSKRVPVDEILVRHDLARV
jgi:nitroreductase